MDEQLKIIVSSMPSWSDYRYRVILVDAIGGVRQRKRYKSGRAALKRIDLWRDDPGATIEDSELNKIAI